MTKYYEDWINPTTQKAEQIEVHEYYFEDWFEGRSPGNWKLGKDLLFNLSENKYHYDLLRKEEYLKIDEERKKVYFNKVYIATRDYISVFKKRYEISEAKDRLLQKEIELFEKLLFDNKLLVRTRTNIDFPLDEIRLPVKELQDSSKLFTEDGKQFNPAYKGETIFLYTASKPDTITICDIREIYEKIIVNGEKDFSLTKPPNNQITFWAPDFKYIRVEAIAKYYKYLIAFKDPIEGKKPLPNQISYKWQGKQHELKEFYNNVKGKFIDKTTSEQDFCKLFEGIILEQVRPVKWISDNATQLLYFVNAMMQAGLLKTERMRYNRLETCFCKRDGSKFSGSWKELYQQIKKGHAPEREDINILINQFR